jgi:tetratricopeptide (TPR) repeat protein
VVLFGEVGDSNSAARALDTLAWLAIQEGHYPEAEALSRESVERARATDDRRLLYSSLGNLAVAVHARGQWTAARELYEEALDVARELGTPFEMGRALCEIARSEYVEGRHDPARSHFAEGLTILHGLGNRPGVIESLEGLACVAAATAAPRRAALLWGSADALRQEIGYIRTVPDSITYEIQVKSVRAILTAEAFDQAWDEGRAMTLDDAVRYALDEQAGATPDAA